MYRFKLQVLLDYRRRVEEGLQIDLSRIQTALERTKQLLLSHQREKSYYQEELARRERRKINLHESIIYRDYLRGIRKRIEDQRDHLATVKIALDKKQEELSEAIKKRKVLEKLKEKHQREVVREQKRKEGIFMDEVSIRRYQQNR